MEEVEKIKALCAKYDIRPTKKFGQNFLVDTRIVRMMVEAANLSVEDNVVEVGPGLGTLTLEMAKRGKRVVAVEVDARLVRVLRDIVYIEAEPPELRRLSLEIFHEDILKISNERLAKMLGSSSYKVVASLPYSITSAVLRKFTEAEPRPTLCVFLVQKEVAERVCARAGAMSILSVAVQYYGKPELVAVVPRSAFWPEPEVESAILRIAVAKESKVAKVTKEFEKHLFQIVRIGFSSRRKQLQNNLSAGLRLGREPVFKALREVGLESEVRAQELSVENWIALSHIL